MTDAWAQIRAGLNEPADIPRNIAAWTLTQHIRCGDGQRVALRWRPRSGSSLSFTYGDLDRAASRFASGLAREGLGPGTVVAVLTGRIPELLVAVLGALRAGAVPTVLFASYGPDPVRRRLALGRARLVVTTPHLYRDKIAPVRGQLPELRHALVVGGPGRLAAMAAVEAPPADTRDFGAWLAQGEPEHPDADMDPRAPGALHFTSGTAGEPRGVVHGHDAVVALAHTGRRVLGLVRGTRFWCTADPGWVTGVSYGILAPLACGSTVFMDQEELDAPRWWENLADERVEVLYTSPGALRVLRHMDAAGVPRAALPGLRAAFSVGEPLAHAEAAWGAEALGVPVRDTWWQTETGCIVVATPFDVLPRPGAVGPAVPGFQVACLRRTDGAFEVAAPGEPGELAVRRGWPSMFQAYVDEPGLYAQCFQGGWYLAGDVASMDDQGWVSFVGRRGDVFRSGGHLVSPAEVEAVVVEHAAVSDVGVWAREDPATGTVIEAHVVLAPGFVEDDTLKRDILGFARARLGPALAPRVVRVRTHLPRTPSGKLIRRALADPLS